MGRGTAEGGGGVLQTLGRTYARARRLRREMTLPEVLLWRELRKRSLGVKFRRQHPVGSYVLDFYCPDLKLAVEIDGWGHNMGSLDRDAVRDRHLLNNGVRTLRFPADLVLKDIGQVVATLSAETAGKAAETTGC